MGKSKPAAGGPKRRRPVSPETRAKLSAALLGHEVSDETRQKISAAPGRAARISATLKGHEVSDETRQRISASKKDQPGHSPSDETRAKIVASNTRRVVSPETRARMSASHTGKKASDETRAKMSATRKGRPRSAETKARVSAGLMGHPVSPETRDKLSARNTGGRFVRGTEVPRYEAFVAQQQAAGSKGRSVLIGDQEVIVKSDEQVRVIELLKRESPRRLSLEEIGEKAEVKSPWHVMSKLREHPICSTAIEEEGDAHRRKFYRWVYRR
jgi:hypothetical protein